MEAFRGAIVQSRPHINLHLAGSQRTDIPRQLIFPIYTDELDPAAIDVLFVYAPMMALLEPSASALSRTRDKNETATA